MVDQLYSLSDAQRDDILHNINELIASLAGTGRNPLPINSSSFKEKREDLPTIVCTN